MAKLKYKVLSDSISYKHNGQRFYALEGEEVEIFNPNTIRRFLANGFIEKIGTTKAKAKDKK